MQAGIASACKQECLHIIADGIHITRSQSTPQRKAPAHRGTVIVKWSHITARHDAKNKLALEVKLKRTCFDVASDENLVEVKSRTAFQGH